MAALEFEEVSKVYANGTRALERISLRVEAGDFFGLLGSNGAGKSTSIGIMTTLVNKSSGRVRIFGHDLDEEPIRAKSMIGVVPQELNMNIFERVRDVVVNQAGYYGVPRKTAEERADYYLERLGLGSRRFHQVRVLSGGMKRRLMIARSLVHQPRLLILDEPSAGVDVELRHDMWKFLKEMNAQGITIILTTHYLEEAEQLCRHIAILDRGEMVSSFNAKQYISQLDMETIVIDLASPVDKVHPAKGFSISQTDEKTLEVQFDRGHTLNELFAVLTAQNIMVMSMRNKTNRLEKLFLDLVQARESE